MNVTRTVFGIGWLAAALAVCAAAEDNQLTSRKAV